MTNKRARAGRAPAAQFQKGIQVMNTLVRENRGSCNGQQATEQFIAPMATVLENQDGYTCAGAQLQARRADDSFNGLNASIAFSHGKVVAVASAHSVTLWKASAATVESLPRTP